MEVVPHQINRFTAWVDVVAHTKGAAAGKREVILKKLQRKASEKITPPLAPSTDNWQELYERRVNK
jgi:hypothetical protein